MLVSVSRIRHPAGRGKKRVMRDGVFVFPNTD
jgi:hypothetical protein